MRTQERLDLMIRFSFCAVLLCACDLVSIAGAPGKPIVTITAPASDVRVSAGTQVDIQSTAIDARGIAWVELCVDGVAAGNQILPSPQGSFTSILRWRATTPGAHVVQVKAYKTAGAVSDAALISIEVVLAIAQATPLAPPVASLASPTPTRAQVTGEPTSAATKSPTRGPYPTPAVTPLATRPPPADLPFHIDCSALEPSTQAACDSYITNTRDTI